MRSHMLPLVGRKMHGDTTGYGCIVQYVVGFINSHVENFGRYEMDADGFYLVGRKLLSEVM